VISTASCRDPTGLLEKNSVLRCDSVCDERDTGEGSLAIVEISEEGVYVETAVVVAGVVVVVAVVVAAVVVAAVVAVAVEELKLIAVVVVVRDALKSMASLSAAVTWLIDVNVMAVIGRWLESRWKS